MRASEVARFLRSLGDGTRLRILFSLARSPRTVGELAGVLRCPVKRLSRHLQYLAARGIVAAQAERRGQVYRLCPSVGRVHDSALALLGAIRDVVDEAGPDQSRAGRLRSEGA